MEILFILIIIFVGLVGYLFVDAERHFNDMTNAYDDDGDIDYLADNAEKLNDD